MTDQSLFGFAGLYDIWKDKQTGKEIWSYTIITTMPNEIVGQYHDRMPVILEKSVKKNGSIQTLWTWRDFADAQAVSV